LERRPRRICWRTSARTSSAALCARSRRIVSVPPAPRPRALPAVRRHRSAQSSGPALDLRPEAETWHCLRLSQVATQGTGCRGKPSDGVGLESSRQESSRRTACRPGVAAAVYARRSASVRWLRLGAVAKKERFVQRQRPYPRSREANVGREFGDTTVLVELAPEGSAADPRCQRERAVPSACGAR